MLETDIKALVTSGASADRDTARAAFEENSKGTLKPGKYADIVILSKDILTIPEDQIPTAQFMYTIVGVKVSYKR